MAVEPAPGARSRCQWARHVQLRRGVPPSRRQTDRLLVFSRDLWRSGGGPGGRDDAVPVAYRAAGIGAIRLEQDHWREPVALIQTALRARLHRAALFDGLWRAAASPRGRSEEHTS